MISLNVCCHIYRLVHTAVPGIVADQANQMHIPSLKPMSIKCACANDE